MPLVGKEVEPLAVFGFGAPSQPRRLTPYNDVYAKNFVGPVEWRFYYRGDQTLRSEFKSSITYDLGHQKSESILNNVSSGGYRDLLEEHGVTSQSSPFISTSTNKKVAEYYARGADQTHNGFVTTFRIDAREAKNLAIANFENPVAFFEINSKIGMPESEYVFRSFIDTKYIYNQVQVMPK